MTSTPKKIFLNFAPVFLDLQIAICKKLISNNNVIGGHIGGSKKHYRKLNQSIHGDFTYTHTKEKKWMESKLDKKKLTYFIELLGNNTLNEIIIADRQIGRSYVTGGRVVNSPILNDLKKDKQSYIRYIVGMLDFILNDLKLKKPDIYIAYAVAGSFTLATYHICKLLNIKFIRLSSTRINKQYTFTESPYDDFLKIGMHFHSSTPTIKNLDVAKKHLNNFRNKPSQPGYQKVQNNIYINRFSKKSNLKLAFKLLLPNIIHKNNFYHSSYRSNILNELSIIKQTYLDLARTKTYKVDEVYEDAFYYFPLHVDPEASTMVQAPMLTNQLYIIEYISKNLPINQALVIKEHLSMLGKRPHGFYEKINSFPRVYLVSHEESSFSLIKKSKAVITITGTAGMEAIFLGKPAIFLGRFLYSFIKNGFLELQGIEEIDKVFNSIGKLEPATDEVIIKLLATIYDNTFEFDSSMVWTGKSQLYIKENPGIIKTITNEILSYQ